MVKKLMPVLLLTAALTLNLSAEPFAEGRLTDATLR